MADILFTTTDKIRSCLGLTLGDLTTDGLLEGMGLEDELITDLEVWLPNYQQIHDDAYPPPAPTPKQARLGRLLSLYCMWFCAWRVSMRPPAFLKLLSDGKNRADRFDFDLEEFQAAMRGEADKLKGTILDELGEEQVIPTPMSLISISEPSFDPVTGE